MMNDCRALMLVFPVWLFGCEPATESAEVPSPPEPAKTIEERFPKFEPMTESQHAIFLTESWTGGGGDPLQTKPGGRTEKVDGLPVLLLFETQQQIRKGLGPQPKGARRGAILVEARIRLERTSVKTSAKGGGSRQAYAVIIEELIASKWYIDQTEQ